MSLLTEAFYAEKNVVGWVGREIPGWHAIYLHFV
jgi:hypothetical protein